MMFLITPAHRQEEVLAIPLLTLMMVCYGDTIRLVRADVGYFITPMMTFICCVLGASFVIDYNLRCKGKQFLETLFFIGQWRFQLRPRCNYACLRSLFVTIPDATLLMRIFDL